MKDEALCFHISPLRPSCSTEAQIKPVTESHFDLNSAKHSLELALKHMGNLLLLSNLNTPSLGGTKHVFGYRNEVLGVFKINSCLAISTNKC